MDTQPEENKKDFNNQYERNAAEIRLKMLGDRMAIRMHEWIYSIIFWMLEVREEKKYGINGLGKAIFIDTEFVFWSPLPNLR